MEGNVHQLVNMGFPADLAAEALAASAGDVGNAAHRLLNHSDRQSPASKPLRSPILQPKIDSFFNFHSKKDTGRLTLEIAGGDGDGGGDSVQRRTKRQKITEPTPTPPPPLSERMRPRRLEEVVGQDHILGENSLLRSAVDSGRLPSIILWGPPGTGKTSIAKAIARSTCGEEESSSSFYRFVFLSAVTAGVKDVRDMVDQARKSSKSKRTVLFLDEVHRFNKAQQDSFLPVIEDGSIVFIGATTENPSFHLITPLLSRCRVLPLHPLKPHHVVSLLNRAVSDSLRGLSSNTSGATFEVTEEAIAFLSSQSDGDARVALNSLESAATAAISHSARDTKSGANKITVTLQDAEQALQCKHLAYDKSGEEHYNLISALHKSMRGGDANASIYWLARMIEGGEQPLYIARRLIRFASEDIGMADPQALPQAIACYQGCHFIGMPECNVILAQCVVYMSMAPKSVCVYRGIDTAQKMVRDSVGQNEKVPLHLRNAPTKMMKELGYGEGYVYPPDDPESAARQSYLPDSIRGYKFLNWP